MRNRPIDQIKDYYYIALQGPFFTNPANFSLRFIFIAQREPFFFSSSNLIKITYKYP